MSVVSLSHTTSRIINEKFTTVRNIVLCNSADKKGILWKKSKQIGKIWVKLPFLVKR